jgi:hypothetical protein
MMNDPGCASRVRHVGPLGENPVCDRSWTMLSLLLMGLLAALFAFNMWVA